MVHRSHVRKPLQARFANYYATAYLANRNGKPENKHDKMPDDYTSQTYQKTVQKYLFDDYRNLA
jgi:hypothetical protein